LKSKEEKVRAERNRGGARGGYRRSKEKIIKGKREDITEGLSREFHEGNSQQKRMKTKLFLGEPGAKKAQG